MLTVLDLLRPFRADFTLMPLFPGLAPWAFLHHPCGVGVAAHHNVVMAVYEPPRLR